jgi:hypothetical protein
MVRVHSGLPFSPARFSTCDFLPVFLIASCANWVSKHPERPCVHTLRVPWIEPLFIKPTEAFLGKREIQVAQTQPGANLLTV